MKQVSSLMILTGSILLALAFLLLVLIYHQVVYEEITYFFSSQGKNVTVALKNNGNKNIIVPKDTSFGIVIPKIGANSKVIRDVDPFNSSAYQLALSKGVAQAKGSAYPGQFGNVFLFSHSSVNFYEASKYNSVFYLLSKLEKGDQIYIFYNKAELKYTVTGKKIVGPNEISYLSSTDYKKHTLTLMTCWPPGTSFERLLVFAQIGN